MQAAAGWCYAVLGAKALYHKARSWESGSVVQPRRDAAVGAVEIKESDRRRREKI